VKWVNDMMLAQWWTKDAMGGQKKAAPKPTKDRFASAKQPKNKASFGRPRRKVPVAASLGPESDEVASPTSETTRTLAPQTATTTALSSKNSDDSVGNAVLKAFKAGADGEGEEARHRAEDGSSK
jgi:hypothetical protein